MKIAICILVLAFHLSQGTNVFHHRRQPPVDWDKEVREFWSRFLSMWTTGDMETLVATLWSKQPFRIPPVLPAQTDPNEIIATYTQLFNAGVTEINLTMGEIQVVQSCGRENVTITFSFNENSISPNGVMVFERPNPRGSIVLKLAIFRPN